MENTKAPAALTDYVRAREASGDQPPTTHELEWPMAGVVIAQLVQKCSNDGMPVGIVVQALAKFDIPADVVFDCWSWDVPHGMPYTPGMKQLFAILINAVRDGTDPMNWRPGSRGYYVWKSDEELRAEIAALTKLLQARLPDPAAKPKLSLVNSVKEVPVVESRKMTPQEAERAIHAALFLPDDHFRQIAPEDDL